MQATLLESAPAPKRFELPPYPGQEPGVEEFRFSFDADVRKAFRSPKKIPTGTWAERHRKVTGGSRPGPWRNENLPYAPGIFDAWDAPFVKEITLCFAPQCGKTEIELTCLASAVDQDPGPAMVVLDIEKNAKDLSKDKLRPMIEESPRLAAYLSDYAADTGTYRIDLVHMPIYLAWATSVSLLASKSIRYMVWDEIDKHEAPSRKEADALSLGAKRQRTFLHTRKTLFASSPTVETGPIWRKWGESVARFKFWARCPDCGAFQILAMGQVKFPEDQRDPERIEAERSAWYECEHCRAKWDDFKRDRAVSFGRWMTESGEELGGVLAAERPVKAGFHLSALYSPFVPLAEIAAAFLRSQADRDKLKDFLNGYLAEPWVDYVVERSEDRILVLRDERPRGLVPSGALALLATADTQDNGFYFEIRAWGAELASWQVKEGFVESFAGLEEVFFKHRYRDAQGRTYPVLKAAIDSMGHRTAEVYAWAKANAGVMPLKGEQRMAQPWRLTTVEFWPGTSKPIPGGQKLHLVNVTYYKDWLARKLEIAPADPGAWRLHAEATEDYARQMCAEYRDARGLWQCPKHKANHHWDVSVYGLWLADMLGVQHWKEARTEKKEEAPARPAAQSPSAPASIPRSLPAWRR